MNGKNLFLTGLLMGTITGVSLALVLAPKGGQETREVVKEGIARGIERVRRRRISGEEIAEAAAEAAEEV
jgi:gas vesicle protein